MGPVLGWLVFFGVVVLVVGLGECREGGCYY